MRIMGPPNVPMIDACHIYPFSLSNDDTVTNGIALSPTLYRSFDQRLNSITVDFKVNVSNLVNGKESGFALTQFENQTIHLPRENALYPSSESLNWHQGI